MDKFAEVAKNTNPFFLLEKQNLSPILEMYFQINHLKQLLRRGWRRKERVSEKHCESVADHCFGMLILAWLIMEKSALDMDVLKVFKMIIAHEFGEIYAGDITPVDAISKTEKHAREKTSVLKIFGKVPGGEIFIELWYEYEAKDSREAIFVTQIDKLEMAFQAAVYELQYRKDFFAFFRSAEEAINLPEIKSVLEEVKKVFL